MIKTQGACVDWNLLGYADDTALEFHPGIAAWTYQNEVVQFRHIDLGGGRVALYDEANQEAYVRMPDVDSVVIRAITQLGEQLNLIARGARGEVYLSIDYVLHAEAYGTTLQRLLIVHRLWVEILEALDKIEDMG